MKVIGYKSFQPFSYDLVILCPNLQLPLTELFSSTEGYETIVRSSLVDSKYLSSDQSLTRTGGNYIYLTFIASASDIELTSSFPFVFGIPFQFNEMAFSALSDIDDI